MYIDMTILGVKRTGYGKIVTIDLKFLPACTYFHHDIADYRSAWQSDEVRVIWPPLMYIDLNKSVFKHQKKGLDHDHE